MHEGPKSHNFQICQKIFESKKVLNTHRHSGQQTKTSSVSNLSEIIWKNLKSQKACQNIHEGLKPYQCQNCKRSFRSTGKLNRHNNNVHEGLKPYQCQSCHKLF